MTNERIRLQITNKNPASVGAQTIHQKIDDMIACPYAEFFNTIRSEADENITQISDEK
jgi:hypothetical protein